MNYKMRWNTMFITAICVIFCKIRFLLDGVWRDDTVYHRCLCYVLNQATIEIPEVVEDEDSES